MERNFGTAQDRLVKGLRVAKAKTLEQANEYLEKKYLPWWDKTLTVVPARDENAHRTLEKTANLAAVLSHVEHRQVDNDHTIRLDGGRYRIVPEQVTSGMRKATVRVEWRLDGSIAVRYQERYLDVERCPDSIKTAAPEPKPKSARKKARRGSDWNKQFDLQKAPPLWHAAESSGYRREGMD